MKGAIFALFLLSNNWNFFANVSNKTTNIHSYIYVIVVLQKIGDRGKSRQKATLRRLEEEGAGS